MKICIWLLIFVCGQSFCYKCGKEGGKATRISGGTLTRPHRYPWMVNVFYVSDPDKGAMMCGGSLITDRLVLTARHCTEEKGNFSIDDFNKIGKVRVGAHDLDDPNDLEETIRVEHTYVRAEEAIQNYCMNGKFVNKDCNDIAILLLKHPVDLRNPKLGTVCLPQSSKQNYNGKSAKAMGWGLVSYNEATGAGEWGQNTLKSVNLNLSDIKDDHFLFTDVDVIDGVHQDACGGDSGGPLVIRENGGWTVVGIVFGNGYDCRDGSVVKDGLGGLGWWTKIGPHLRWIKQIIKKYEKPKPIKVQFVQESAIKKGLRNDKNVNYVVNKENKFYLIQGIKKNSQ